MFLLLLYRSFVNRYLGGLGQKNLFEIKIKMFALFTLPCFQYHHMSVREEGNIAIVCQNELDFQAKLSLLEKALFKFGVFGEKAR